MKQKHKILSVRGVFEALLAGKKLRCDQWTEGAYIKLKDKDIEFHGWLSNYYWPHSESLLKLDLYEYVEEPEKYSFVDAMKMVSKGKSIYRVTQDGKKIWCHEDGYSWRITISAVIEIHTGGLFKPSAIFTEEDISANDYMILEE